MDRDLEMLGALHAVYVLGQHRPVYVWEEKLKSDILLANAVNRGLVRFSEVKHFAEEAWMCIYHPNDGRVHFSEDLIVKSATNYLTEEVS